MTRRASRYARGDFIAIVWEDGDDWRSYDAIRGHVSEPDARAAVAANFEDEAALTLPARHVHTYARWTRAPIDWDGDRQFVCPCEKGPGAFPVTLLEWGQTKPLYPWHREK